MNHLNKFEWIVVIALTACNGYYFFNNMTITDKGIELTGTNFENSLWPFNMVIFWSGLTVMFMQIPPVKRRILR